MEKTGLLSFTSGASSRNSDLGALFYFDFGCGDPCTPITHETPVACNVTVTAGCWAYSDDLSWVFPYYHSETFNYVPAAGRYAPMTQVYFDSESGDFGYFPGIEYETRICWNCSFEALQLDGTPAFLYLDDVIVKGLSG